MKTKFNISILSIMLLFATISLFAGTTGITTKTPPNTVIVHQVNIPAMPDKSFCGSYVIEVRNQAGQLVAPPKNLVPGQSRYIFFEKSEPSTGEQVRTAMLRQTSGNGSIQCSWVLTAEPATLKAIFKGGNTYNYNLFPKPMQVIK